MFNISHFTTEYARATGIAITTNTNNSFASVYGANFFCSYAYSTLAKSCKGDF